MPLFTDFVIFPCSTHVLARRYTIKMVRVDAGTVLTKVVDLIAFGNRPNVIIINPSNHAGGFPSSRRIRGTKIHTRIATATASLAKTLGDEMAVCPPARRSYFAQRSAFRNSKR